MKRCRMGLLLIGVAVMVLVGCGRSKEEIKTAQTEITTVFKAYGFKGTPVVTDAVGETFATSFYDADVTYTEEVDGRELTFEDSLGYSEEGEDTSPEAVASAESLVDTFTGIATDAMWEQPEGKKMIKAIDAVFEKAETDRLEYQGFYGSLEWESNHLSDYYQIVDRNRKAGKPLQGLYDIPIKKLMAKEVIRGNVDLHLSASADQEEKWDEEDEAKKHLIAFVKEADLSKLPDGKYGIGFDVKTDKGTISDGISDYFFFFVRNGQLVHIDEDYEF